MGEQDRFTAAIRKVLGRYVPSREIEARGSS
jgi:hypothetical protein